MDYETKKITYAWSERCVGDDELSDLDSRLWEIRKTWEKCRDLLAEEGRTLYYEISQDRIDTLMEQMQSVADYAQEIGNHFSAYQDEPLYRAFVNGATEYLSRIKLEEFQTADTVSGRVADTGDWLEAGFEPGLGFSDFLGEWAVEEMEEAGAVSAEDVLVAGGAAFLGTELKEEPLLAGVDADAGMMRFAEYFGKQYYELEKAGAFEEGEIEEFSDYLDALEVQGEFEHSMDKPVLEFLNGVLDLLIVPPLIEAVRGEAFLTGEDLNSYQRGMKVLSAVLDVMSIGQASMALGITKVGTRQALGAVGKVAVVEIGSNLAAYGAVSLGEKLDLPVPLTILLGVSVGAGVNRGLGKVVYANPNGMRARRIARETPDPEIPVLRNTDEVLDGRRGVSEGGLDVVQSKFNKLLNSDYYKNNSGYDCSEIATDFYDAAGQQGTIYRIEGKNGVINGYEYGKVFDFEYHEVYSDGVYIYDPRYQNTPVLKDDYFRALKEINPDGFDVFTIQ